MGIRGRGLGDRLVILCIQPIAHSPSFVPFVSFVDQFFNAATQRNLDYRLKALGYKNREDRSIGYSIAFCLLIFDFCLLTLPLCSMFYALCSWLLPQLLALPFIVSGGDALKFRPPIGLIRASDCIRNWVKDHIGQHQAIIVAKLLPRIINPRANQTS